MFNRVKTPTCIVLLIFLLSQLHLRTDQNELGSFHIDEPYWIGSTYYYKLAWKDLDWTHPDWQLLPARENPPHGKYLMGAWLDLNGKQVDDPTLLGAFLLHFQQVLPDGWGQGESKTKRANVVARMNPVAAEKMRNTQGAPLELDIELLKLGRQFAYGAGLLSAIGVFCLGYVTKDAVCGLFAAYLYLSHPIFKDAAQLAMVDSLAILLVILIILMLAIRLGGQRRIASRSQVSLPRSQPRSQPGVEVPELNWRTRLQSFTSSCSLWYWLSCFTMGTLIGWASGTKMNALVAVGVILVTIGLHMIEYLTGIGGRTWAALQTASQTSPIIRTITSQVSHRDPSTCHDRRASSANADELAGAITAMDHRSHMVWNTLALMIGFTVFAVLNPTVCQDPIGGLWATIEEHRITGKIQGEFSGRMMTSMGERWVAVQNMVFPDPILTVVLYASLVWHGCMQFRRHDLSVVILIWWFVGLFLLLMWIPFAWNRYVLPIVPPTALVLGRSFADLLDGLTHLVRNVFRNRKSLASDM